MMKETFGQHIHKLRVENKLTLTKLAAALDIDQSTLSKIENHKRKIPDEIIPKLADVFNLNLLELEMEFLSEKIAEILIQKDDTNELLRLAKEKVKYFRVQNSIQGQIKFKDEKRFGKSKKTLHGG